MTKTNLEVITYTCKRCGASVSISTDIKHLSHGKLCVWCAENKKGGKV